MGKRNLEEAISSNPDTDFEVRWLPFQLNPGASEVPSSKVEAYMNKFGRSRDQVMQMAMGMKSKFTEANLPFQFGDESMTSNTFQGHRVLTLAYQTNGHEAQDKAAEIMFHNYFSQHKAPNDPETLRAAAVAAGLDADAVLSDTKQGEAKTIEELDYGRKIGVSGVPHFIISKEGGAGGGVQLGGAQPAAAFTRVFSRLS